MNREETIQHIMDELGKDEDVRSAVIRKLASNFPQDFLAPVKINSEDLDNVFGGEGGWSNKEWQE